MTGFLPDSIKREEDPGNKLVLIKADKTRKGEK